MLYPINNLKLWIPELSCCLWFTNLFRSYDSSFPTHFCMSTSPVIQTGSLDYKQHKKGEGTQTNSNFNMYHFNFKSENIVNVNIIMGRWMDYVPTSQC